MHGLKEYGCFDGYGDRPPRKNGDFAWLLLHIIKSLKRNGKAAVILPQTYSSAETPKLLYANHSSTVALSKVSSVCP